MLHGQFFVVILVLWSSFSCIWWYSCSLFCLILLLLCCQVYYYVDSCWSWLCFFEPFGSSNIILHTKKPEKTKCSIMLRVIWAVFHVRIILSCLFLHSLLMDSSCRMLVFWIRNAFTSILVRHCVGRHTNWRSNHILAFLFFPPFFFVRTRSQVVLLSIVNWTRAHPLC